LAGSLQDQFLKAGLVSTKQAKKAQHETRKSKKKGGKKKADTAVPNTEADAAQRAKAASDRVRNEAITQEREAKERRAQVRQLIERHALPDTDGDMAFNLQIAGVVRTLNVSAQVRARLVTGDLAIVSADTTLAFVPADVATRINTRDPDCIRSWARNDTEEPSVSADETDDPYADHVVPDDLVW
jgi:uncharacterized protein YaiL (DUF2058 family)